MTFTQKLEKAIDQNNSLLCVGLDPDIEKIKPLQGLTFKQGETLFKFNKQIIDQTSDLVCAYKPNIAFYAAAGTKGLQDLKRTIGYIHKNYPTIPVLLDAKRGDIGHTSEMYTKEVFDVFEADAVTVNPYCGFDSLEPFFKRSDKGIIVLCKTSNPGAKDIQDLIEIGEPLYIQVAKKIISWNRKYGNLLMVIGATSLKELKRVRDLTADMTFLIPGVGAQGGDFKKTIKNGLRKDGRGLIISASRSIIYDQDPRGAAQKIRDEINKYR